VFRLAPLRHAYACTVHKSQGSTYDISMVDFSDVFRSDDKARLIYVAATRASKFLVFAK
jgi:ATP-dependent exoDNAse (exonuclease V) alpha subunit